MYLQGLSDKEFMELGVDYNYDPKEQTPKHVNQESCDIPHDVIARHKAVLEGNIIEGYHISECAFNEIKNNSEIIFTKMQLMCHVFIKLSTTGNFETMLHVFPSRNLIKYLLTRYQNDSLYIDFINQQDSLETLQTLIKATDSLLKSDHSIPNLFIWEIYPNYDESIPYGGKFGEKMGLSYVMDKNYLTIWKYKGEELELVFSTSGIELKKGLI